MRDSLEVPSWSNHGHLHTMRTPSLFSRKRSFEGPSRLETGELATMGSPTTPTSPTKSARLRDTGFPEPFCGNGNTTLPHPDADLSPNASISSNDIPLNRVLSRSRRSFLAKNRHTLSHGRITEAMGMDQMYSGPAAAQQQPGGSRLISAPGLDDKEPPVSPLGTSAVSPFANGIVSSRPPKNPATAGRLSKDSAVSLDDHTTSSNEDGSEGDSPHVAKLQTPSPEQHRRRSGMFRRLGIHHHS